jgi:hypothetical protein
VEWCRSEGHISIRGLPLLTVGPVGPAVCRVFLPLQRDKADRGLAIRQMAFDTRYWTGKQWVVRH